jgi:sugar transferase EpsL
MVDQPPGYYVKRILDMLLITVVSPIVSTLLGVVGILVLLLLGRPVLFAQKRAGLRGKVFLIYKFRSMTDGVDGAGRLLPDADRLTRFGRFLRSTSLDELPTLVNVIKGEMSLVGPRPLLAQYLPRYNALQMRRHEVLPGLTGWAQVNGRNALSWDEKFAHDLWYVEHRTLWLDLKILWLTIIHLFTRRGISAPDHATMPEFLAIARTPDSAQSSAPLPPDSTSKPTN